MTRLLALLLVGVSGCATSPPPAPAPTLAALDAQLARRTVTVVRLDGTVEEPFRLTSLTADFVRGVRGTIDPRSVAIPTVGVREIRYEGEADLTRGAAYGVAGVLPGLVCVGLGLNIAGDDVSPAEATGADLLVATGVAASMLGLGLGVAAGARPPTVVVRIAPLSQFSDAPRGGVRVP